MGGPAPLSDPILRGDAVPQKAEPAPWGRREMGQHPWECRQHRPRTGGGPHTPPCPADDNLAQIIILNY